MTGFLVENAILRLGDAFLTQKCFLFHPGYGQTQKKAVFFESFVAFSVRLTPPKFGKKIGVLSFNSVLVQLFRFGTFWPLGGQVPFWRSWRPVLSFILVFVQLKRFGTFWPLGGQVPFWRSGRPVQGRVKGDVTEWAIYALDGSAFCTEGLL